MFRNAHLHSLPVCFIFAQSTGAIGSGKVDDTVTIGFVQEDNKRDTVSLLISCFATLGLCVYSAVHLNVPRKGERSYQVLLRELKWCIVGLFAPELILYTAWRQLASAKQLCCEIEEAKLEHVKRQKGAEAKTFAITEAHALPLCKHRPWSLAHGFYGVMGGFAIDLENEDGQRAHLFGEHKRLTLTANGISLLAHCGHIPNISIHDIQDKNKADGLAKLLVCIQAGWMTVQVINRAASGLPISLLEVHTVAHVVCALIMYGIWWHKPRQVESPTILRAEELWPLAAYFYLASCMSGEVPKGRFRKFRNATPQLTKLAYFEDSRSASHELQPTLGRQDTARTYTNGHFRPRPQGSATKQMRVPLSPVPESEIDSALKHLAAEAVQRYPALRSRLVNTKEQANTPLPYIIPHSAELIQPHALDWPNAGLLRRTQSLVMGMVLWGASTAYGAIHVAAWDYFFPTTIEQLFWRLSSVWVTFCAAFWLLTNMLAHVFPFIDKIWILYNERKLGWIGTILISTLCVLCGVSYIVSRAYLVIEAFASIREVPVDVYTTPSWSQLVPHL